MSSENEVENLFIDIWKNINELISIIFNKSDRYEYKEDAHEKDKILLFLRINIPILNKYNVNNVKINNKIGTKENILDLIHKMNDYINVINKELFSKKTNKKHSLDILLIKMKSETSEKLSSSKPLLKSASSERYKQTLASRKLLSNRLKK